MNLSLKKLAAERAAKPVVLDEELYEVTGGCDKSCGGSCGDTCPVTCEDTCKNSCMHTELTVTVDEMK